MISKFRKWLKAREDRGTRQLAEAQLSLALASGDKVRANRLKSVLSNLEQ